MISHKIKGLDGMSSVKYKNRELELKARKCVIELGNCFYEGIRIQVDVNMHTA